MFIRNRKIRSLIFLTCAAAMMAQPTVITAQITFGGGQKPAFGNAQQSRNPNMEMLSYNNMDIYAFINDMARRLGLTPMLIDPSVQGTVDFTAEIPRESVFDIFNGILKSRSAALVKQNSFYQVVPISAAIRNDLEIISDPPEPVDGEPSTDIPPVQPAAKPTGEAGGAKAIPTVTRVISPDFVAVEDILDAVRLFVSDNVPIITYKRRNMMIITDYADNARRIKDFVEMLDSSYFDHNLCALIKIENSNALDIADELKKIFGASGADNAATGVSFVPIERINAIFVMAASKRALGEAKDWINELDTYDGRKYQTYVYIVQDSTASNIATLLLALYGDGSSNTGSSGTSNRSSNRTTGTTTGRTGTGTNSTSNSTSSLISQALGGDSSAFSSASQLGPRLDTSSSSVTSIVLSGGDFSSLRDQARVVVDDTNNVLHIQATPADYRSLLTEIEKMDVPPRQVFIEARILEIDLKNELTYGFRAWLESRSEGNLTTAGMSDDGNGWLSAESFAYIGKSRQIIMTIDALKTKTNVKTLQQPTVLAMDGTQASFLSGAEVPYQSQSYYTGNGTATGIDYRETGVTLQVLPRISASGKVTMEIVQEVSTVVQQTVGDVTAPVFPATRVTNTFQVSDGETVAIAGLISNENTWMRAGIPILSDIPVIGALFGGTNQNKTRKEIIILITPHVIRTQERFQEYSQSLLDSLRHVRKYSDEVDKEQIIDIESSRKDREKKELSNIKEIKQPKRVVGD